MHATYLTHSILSDFCILIKSGNEYSYELQNYYTYKAYIMLTEADSLLPGIFNCSYILAVNSFSYLSYYGFTIKVDLSTSAYLI
jgi:hypothetical protein